MIIVLYYYSIILLYYCGQPMPTNKSQKAAPGAPASQPATFVGWLAGVLYYDILVVC